MKFLIQRVRSASVEINNEITGKIENGLLIFIGVCDSDTKEIADKMIKKPVTLEYLAMSKVKQTFH